LKRKKSAPSLVFNSRSEASRTCSSAHASPVGVAAIKTVETLPGRNPVAAAQIGLDPGKIKKNRARALAAAKRPASDPKTKYSCRGSKAIARRRAVRAGERLGKTLSADYASKFTLEIFRGILRGTAARKVLGLALFKAKNAS